MGNGISPPRRPAVDILRDVREWGALIDLNPLTHSIRISAPLPAWLIEEVAARHGDIVALLNEYHFGRFAAVACAEAMLVPPKPKRVRGTSKRRVATGTKSDPKSRIK